MRPSSSPAATRSATVQSDMVHSDIVTAAPAAPLRRALDRAREYVRLTKPRVVELLLVTTVPSMVLAEGAWPSTTLVLAVVVGGALAAGGANTINAWLERDRDRLMRRTHARPLPSGSIVPANALRFGIALNVVAFALLWAQANLLAASLTIGATLFYVFVYTIWLKPRTVHNIVIGGAAGAAPVLVGWSAVTGTLDPEPWVLFSVIFFWTPAHFWALALRYRDDYERAGIPMLPVVRGVAATTRQILAYAIATVAASLLLIASDYTHTIYTVACVALGSLFVAAAIGLVRRTDPKRAMRFFSWSNLYLSLLFAAIAVDVLVG